MATKTINAEMLSKMFLAGAANIEAKKEFINELNVFPVPDGDTGTNMSLTIMAAAKEVSALETIEMETLAKAISSGSLRGARGNSGVILSQLFRGFTKAIRDKEEIDVNSIHRYKVKKVGNEFIVNMFSFDGIIEGIECKDKNHFVLGVQFHPELLEQYNVIFERFIYECVNKDI